MLTCDDPNLPDDDVEEERHLLPAVRPVANTDQFTPPARPDWHVVLRLPLQPHPTAVGMWIGAVAEAQYTWPNAIDIDDGGQILDVANHAIVRDKDGSRVLLAHPSCIDAAVELINEFDGHGECCSGTHICEPEQDAFARVQALRVWRRMSLVDRIEAADAGDLEIGVAIKSVAFAGEADMAHAMLHGAKQVGAYAGDWL